MNCNFVKIGDYTQKSSANNRELKYGVDKIQGVSQEGKFITPRRDTTDLSLYRYFVVDNGAFVYNSTALDSGAIAYRTEGLCIVSHLCVVFYLNEKGQELFDPLFLYMYFRRKEFYRRIGFMNFGSTRPEFTFKEFSSIRVPLIPLHIQQKYVNIYKALLANQQAYERGLDDLKLVCDGYIEDLRRKMPCERIGRYIRECNERNDDNSITLFQGVNVEHEFTEPKRIAEDAENGCIVRTGQFAFNKVMKAHNTKLPVALREGVDCVVSNSYQVFDVIDKDKLLPQYLMLWLNRSETQRHAGFVSFGTTRDIFSFSDMCNVSIPIPDISIQKSIANIYNVYITRKQINERLKAQIKNVCPILIKGAIEESQSEAE